MIISVCICTFRRPAMLASLLSGLERQDLSFPNTPFEVVVVDNDPIHSARSVLETWPGSPTFTLSFVHVPEPNISVARNTAVRKASGNLLVFIDDDETPSPHWLKSMLETQRRFDADAVFGPVIPSYHPQTPTWIRQGGFFDRRRFITGTLIDERDARAGNVLIKAELLKPLDHPFEQSFGRTGGEDSLLFRDLLARGNSLIWCDEAPVFEEIPIERANAAWLLRRSFRTGQSGILTELYRLPFKQRLVRGIFLNMRAIIQLFVSLGCALACLPASRVKAFHWLRTAVVQTGKLTAMTRFQYKEYGSECSN